MKNCMKIIPFILAVCFLFSACTSDSLVTTQRTTEATTEKTTETLTETAEITTEATTQKEIYYPTEEEYLELFDSELSGIVNYTKSYDSSTNSVTLSWDFTCTAILTLHCSLGLYKNEENRITWAMLNVLHEKFGNNFTLLSEEMQTSVIAITVMPLFMLACLHNGKTFSKSDLFEKMKKPAIQIISGEKNGDYRIYDCDYYVGYNYETGITSMLDYGGKTH